MQKFILLFSILISLCFSAQQNYEWFKINKYRTAVLSDSINENSSLDFFNKRLFTINDSGNSSEIFEINKETGKIENVLKTNLINRDWEAITSDSTNLYVGDFGNNVGSRKDLVIYKIPMRDSIDLAGIEQFPFYYPEQKDFTPKNLNNNFDAEAMIFLNGKIHIFTKEWASKLTTHYIIDPAISENQAAQKIENFPTGYVVTDAAYFNQKLYLVGYTKKAEVFLTIFNETKPGIFFEDKPKKYYLGSSLTIGQIEGIAVDEQGIYISGEEFNLPIIKVKPYLYFIPFEKLK
ncbi:MULTISPECIES: hypothetical protein [unclassified Kaistella]|uniref:hypothetical protein n=1 Tax=unclassified Kaistella TaxID=2762626 RepID=UPI002736F542|nr:MULTISPECIES: hypothetical protein [unclassified Kaistella]MDP2455040.1 hypothetical protein [Kaistella sp. SH11-4b]MDP2457948.1 hypothetical protein [Kaistella sp. SH40-3]MDP2460908.1 hypothetical protein [Kaistella sp. SH19-2b]